MEQRQKKQSYLIKFTKNIKVKKQKQTWDRLTNKFRIKMLQIQLTTLSNKVSKYQEKHCVFPYPRSIQENILPLVKNKLRGVARGGGGGPGVPVTPPW